ncbi:MAG TPA: AgmX/PglI C-terminal domain-containing protein [Polyangia bacterium]
MKIVCDNCATKYSIADEKVRGKVLKVRCKTCENIITVREGGATIDEPHGDASKEAPLSRSGTLEGGAGGAGTAGAPAGRRLSGAVAPLGSATAHASARPTLPAAAFTDPLAPQVAPPPRRQAPTPGPAAALATVVDDGLEWYLAVDGAQTGPFNRPTLIQKILAVPAGGDIHIWNADLGSWKPPKEVADVLADLVRVKRASQPPPAPRRPTGPVPPLSNHGAPGPHGPAGAEADPAARRTGTNGVAAALAAHGAGEHKSNGVSAAAAGTAGRGGPLTVEDLFSESGAAAIGGGGADAAAGAGALPATTMTSSGGLVPALASAAAAATGLGALGRPSRQVKLMIGAGALVFIICAIVAVAVLRKPAAPSGPSGPVAAPAPTAPKAPEPTTPAAATPPATPPAVTETPSVAKIDSHPETRAERGGKGGRVKGRRRGEGGLSPTSPPPMTGGALTAEQLQAANRFGDSSSRDVRASSSSGSAARSTPAQADISRVITNNRQGIQTCYQRALLRDSTLTQGRVTVRVWIGLSGKVKSVSLDAPSAFRSMEPCVRDVMSRWAFPPSSEEYGTEFPFLLQGNQ